MKALFKQPFRITNKSDSKCLVKIEFISFAYINDILISFNGSEFTNGIQDQIVLPEKSYLEIKIDDEYLTNDEVVSEKKKYIISFKFEKLISDNTQPRIFLSGNINSLFTSRFIDDDYFRYPNRSNSLPVAAFDNMFQENDLIESAEDLILPSLTRLGYQGLFAYCRNLKLPPKTLFYFADKFSTFQTEVPSYCFQAMFKCCTSLQKIPKFISTAYFHRNACDQMFDGCESLTDISDFTNVIIGANEYAFRSCFAGCKNLEKFPENIKLFAINTVDNFQQGALYNMFDVVADWKLADDISEKVMSLFKVSTNLYLSDSLRGLFSHIFGDISKQIIETYGSVFRKNSRLFFEK